MSSSFSASSFWDDDSSGAGPTEQHEFTQEELSALIYIAMSFSALSALGQIFIIATFWKFPRLHTFAYKVILALAVANLCLDGAYLVGNVGHDNWKCSFQGFARVYFSLVEFGLITSITLTCYVMIVKHEFGIQERFRTVMAYCWLVPLAMAALPFTTDNYGDAGAWCSITSKDLKSLEWGTFWRFSVIYIPLWVAVALNAYMCVTVYRAVKGFEAAMVAYDEPPDQPSPPEEGDAAVDPPQAGGARGGAERQPSSTSSTSMAIVNRLRLYPIALVVCWSWATINRVHEAISPYDSVFWLYVLQYAFQTSHGVWNLMIFLRTPTVMQEWRDEVSKWPLFCQRRTTIDRSSLLRTMSSEHSKS